MCRIARVSVGEILFISKPIAPPWNDSGKNLVHDLARSLTRHRAVVMTRKGTELRYPNASLDYVYPVDAGGFAPGLINNARVLARLMTGARKDLWHFFFAPNLRSSQMGRFAKKARGMRTVHTIASAPKADARINDVFFADVNVVLSKHTEDRLLQGGLAADRMVRIAPAVSPLEIPTEQARAETRVRFDLPSGAPVIVYPGDLEFGGGAQLMIEAFARLHNRDAHLVMACRAKTQGASAAAQDLLTRARTLGVDARVRWPGETREIHALLGAADVVALPARDLYAKMDYPLVLLEAMCMGRAVVVADETPAQELASAGGAVSVDARNEGALTAKLNELIDDSAQRAQIGAIGRQNVLTKYSPDTMAAAYERVYDALLV